MKSCNENTAHGFVVDSVRPFTLAALNFPLPITPYAVIFLEKKENTTLGERRLSPERLKLNIKLNSCARAPRSWSSWSLHFLLPYTHSIFMVQSRPNNISRYAAYRSCACAPMFVLRYYFCFQPRIEQTNQSRFRRRTNQDRTRPNVKR